MLFISPLTADSWDFARHFSTSKSRDEKRNDSSLVNGSHLQQPRREEAASIRGIDLSVGGKSKMRKGPEKGTEGVEVIRLKRRLQYMR